MRRYLSRKFLVFIMFLYVGQGLGQWKKEHAFDYKKYGDTSNGKASKDSLVYFYYENKIVKGVGRVALEGRTPSNLKVGHWKEFRANGTIEAEGSYKIGSYIQCCYAGPCHWYYHYRYGKWKYYDVNGELCYELEFVPTELRIKTSCDGGDDLLFGLVKEIPIDYDDIVTTDTIVKRQKVEIINDIGLVKMVPLNGILYWE
ncbi:toxin-antitoxin system YwqK family antitoxin [Sediminicola luteus]|uniref:Uncharacterized protein n=1 Tax=Sediminicola luteus TaxID=319238 RepID=A0A2A4G6Z8_9FLAO|nr:hypothetical protein [Sediminicola luteus]PCE64739.1 hypothetical protein B7P33_06095 [Sediminicola luteus]